MVDVLPADIRAQHAIGSPVKFTIGVTAFDGERTAAFWKMKPYDVVDAYGRCAKQVQAEDGLIAIEWLAPMPDDSFSGASANWSAKPAGLPRPPKIKR